MGDILALMRALTLIAASLTLIPCAVAQTPSAETITPPADQKPILTVLGRGAQVYTCQRISGSWQWTLTAPDAILYDSDSVKVGTHTAGPTWTYKDSSSVKGEAIQRSPAPEPGAIPWLLLRATTHTGDGLFSRIESITRTQTHGGVASTTGCDAQHANTTSRIPYTATYTFYTSKP